MENLLRGSIWSYYSSIFFWWINATFFEFLIFAFASYLLGKLILRALKIDFEYNSERVIYFVMLGYGAFGIFGMWLAVFGQFYALYLRIALTAVFLISAKEIFYETKFLWRRLSTGYLVENLKSVENGHAFTKLMLLLLISTNFLIALHPITGNDARMYHVPIVFDIMEKGKFTFSENVDTFYTYVPVLAETIYAVPAVIFGEESYWREAGRKMDVPAGIYVFQLIQYSSIILLLGLFYFFLKDLIKDKLFIFAALFFTVGNFDLQREVLHAGYVEALTFLYGIASSLLLIQAFKSENPKNKILLSSVMLGLSLGMKYLAVFFGIINLVFLCVYFWKRRAEYYELTGILLKYGLVLALVSGYWYGKNLVTYGNPIYPIFSDPSFMGSIGWWISDRTLFNMVVFPFMRYGRWFVAETQTSSQLFILGLYVFMYFFLALFFWKKEKIGIEAFLLFLFVQIYTSSIFFVSHQNRFVLPASVMLAPLAAILLDKLYALWQAGLWGNLGNLLHKIMRPALVFVFVILFLGNFHYFGVKYLYLMDFYDRATYIREIGGQ